MTNKGKISAVLQGGKAVTVKPYSGEVVTSPLVVPFFLYGALPVGMEVVYTTFPDGTGIVLARMDGEFNRRIPGSVEVEGEITASDVITDAASFNTHTHPHPYGQTGTPE